MKFKVPQMFKKPGFRVWIKGWWKGRRLIIATGDEMISVPLLLSDQIELRRSESTLTGKVGDRTFSITLASDDDARSASVMIARCLGGRGRWLLNGGSLVMLLVLGWLYSIGSNLPPAAGVTALPAVEIVPPPPPPPSGWPTQAAPTMDVITPNQATPLDFGLPEKAFQ